MEADTGGFLGQVWRLERGERLLGEIMIEEAVAPPTSPPLAGSRRTVAAVLPLPILASAR
ncbi:hypothetical protein GCM10023084_22250 [Streptomyces lacrimifluminis]|uniref:Uncharacterized protein n=1 Tax=Streptomyces lacrimifluminis TaxID=1500077 RepID=A0A917L115_9ACTN|nr:hypothetical protein GCM10012282_36460 [Streptomyces lacrimifluminis]